MDDSNSPTSPSPLKRQLTRRQLLKGAAAVAVSAAAAACAPSAPPPASTKSAPAPTAAGAQAAQAPAGQPTVGQKSEPAIAGIASNPTVLDPGVTLDGYAYIAAWNSYDNLVRTKRGTIDIEPAVATTWTTSGDGKKWNFTLRDDVKFQDGSPLDSKAVKFSIERILKIQKGPYSGFACIDTVDAPDAKTVVFNLKYPFAPFLGMLTTFGGAIVNPKVMEKEQNGDLGQAFLAQQPMGSGPYLFKQWTPGQQILLEAWDQHWEGQPSIPKLLIKIVSETTDLRLQLEKGDLDWAWGLDTDQIVSLASTPGTKLVEKPGLDFIYIYINNKKPPFDNVKVRQAMGYAVDYERLVKDIQRDHAKVLKGPMTDGQLFYTPDLFGYTRDVAKAKQLLAEAGFPNGIQGTMLFATSTKGSEQVAPVIQANMADAGIKLNIQQIAEATRRERVDKGDFELSLGEWLPGTTDPYWTMNVWHDSHNLGLAGDRSFYKNDQVDQLLQKAIETSNAGERATFYRQAYDQIMKDEPYVYLYQRNTMMPLRDWVQGFEVTAGSANSRWPLQWVVVTKKR